MYNIIKGDVLATGDYSERKHYYLTLPEEKIAKRVELIADMKDT